MGIRCYVRQRQRQDHHRDNRFADMPKRRGDAGRHQPQPPPLPLARKSQKLAEGDDAVFEEVAQAKVDVFGEQVNGSGGGE